MKKLILILMILSVALLYGCTNNPAELDDFAKCLNENGAEFYGAEWCPHCQEQKAMFGDALKYLDFTECTEDQQKCADEGIEYLPTWKFVDGTSVSGVKSYDYLAEKTGCSLS